MALRGIKVIEMIGLAPGPFCGMVLADFGASVTVVQKIEPSPFETLTNGKKAIALNLKSPEGVETLKQLCNSADILLDTYRPGVMERLGLGPQKLLELNPKLIYARLSGFGQNGPLVSKGGHDINYVALSGVLSLLSSPDSAPKPPINLLADFAGGGMVCAMGVIAALFERSKSGLGQIVDASMVEGTSYLASWVFRSKDLPIWSGPPGTNILDGGAPFYGTYKTKDGRYMSVGALEPQFYSQFIEGLGLDQEEYAQFVDFQVLRDKFKEVFLTKTQKEWSLIFDKLDACVVAVLEPEESFAHAQSISRGSWTKDSSGVPAPVPAPRLSRTPSQSTAPMLPPDHGEHTITILKSLGYTDSQIEQLIKNGHVYGKKKSLL